MGQVCQVCHWVLGELGPHTLEEEDTGGVRVWRNVHTCTLVLDTFPSSGSSVKCVGGPGTTFGHQHMHAPDDHY